MAETTIALNPGTGGAQVAVYADSTQRSHQEVVIQTQSGTNDPVSVSASNPLPITQAGPLQAGSNAIGSVAINAALPTGSNTIGAVNQGTPPWSMVGNVAAGNADSGAGVKVSGVYNTTPPTLTNGQRGDAQLDSAGNLCINLKAGGVPAEADGAAFTAGSTPGIAMVGVYNDAVAALTTGNCGVPRLTSDRKVMTANGAAAVGGWTPYKLISAASTNAASVKASAGNIGAINAANNSATNWAYVKVYNKASAPTVGTDVPVHTFGLPPSGGNSFPVPAGVFFSTGIAVAITGGMADADTTATAANQVALNIDYL